MKPIKLIFTILFCGLLIDASHAHNPTEKATSELQTVEKKLDDISQQSLSYFEKAREILDLIDNPEKTVETLEGLGSSMKGTLFTISWIKSIITFFLKIAAVILFYKLVRRFFHRLVDYQMEFLAAKRELQAKSKSTAVLGRKVVEETVSPILKNTISWLLRAIAFIMILDVMRINVLPLIFSVTLLGVGFTLASQNMLKDIINSILTLMHGTVLIGEVVEINGRKGVVENLNLRALTLRVGTGELEIIPFSNIKSVLNFSRDFAFSVSKIVISYEEHVDKVEKCLRAAFDRLRQDDDMKDNVDPELRFFGIYEFEKSGYTVMAMLKTLPDPYRRITQRFNRYIFEEMKQQKIIFPKFNPLLQEHH